MTRAAPALVLLASIGCADGTSTADPHRGPDIGTRYGQCDGRSPGTSSGAAAAAVAAAFVPAGATVRCSSTTGFTVEGAQVTLVYLAYGELQDCPSGCFSSFLCALATADGPLQYSAMWVPAGERPMALQGTCPDDFPVAGGDTRRCTELTPGAKHPVTATPAFTAMAAEGTSTFGACFAMAPKP